MHQAAATDRERLSGVQSSLFSSHYVLVLVEAQEHNLSLNAARLRAMIRVSTAPLVTSYMSSWSPDGQGHFLPM